MNHRGHQTLQNSSIHRTVLPNGMVVIAVENTAADIIAARIFVRAGGLWEPPSQAGISHLLAAVMTKGTARLSSLEIAEQVESVGASLSTDSTTDYFLLSIKTVTADFANLLELAAELLTAPSFPTAEVELERRLTLQGIRSQQEQPFSVAFEMLRQGMYCLHPYGFSSLGSEETVANLGRDDLCLFHQNHFRPDNTVISIAGNMPPEECIELVERVFGQWQAPSVPIVAPQLPIVKVNPTVVRQAQETQQAIVMLGYLAPPVQFDSVNASGAKVWQSSLPSDYAAIKLLNTYLGNGLSSRLFVELREKRGLAYDVSAFYPTRLEPAMFVVYIGTAPENAAIALEGLRTEVERLRTIELTPEELLASKNKLLGQYALGKQTNSQIAQVLGWYETLGLGIEFDNRFPAEISAISAAIANEAARRYFTEPYISIVGPASALQKTDAVLPSYRY